jgi:hypothetical protein
MTEDNLHDYGRLTHDGITSAHHRGEGSADSPVPIQLQVDGIPFLVWLVC